MTILYLYQYFTTPKVSGGTRAYDLAKKFVQNGHEVIFITTSHGFSYKPEGRWQYLELEQMKFHVLNIERTSNSTSYFKRIINFLKFIWFASFKILKLKGDVVLASSTPLTIGIPALIKKWKDKTPFIFEARDVWPEAVIAIGAIKNKMAQSLLYKLEATIYKNAAAIIPLSIDMKASITKRYPNLKCPIISVENIAALERFKNEYNPNVSFIEKKLGFKPRFTILYAGTFGRVNGLSYVIELAAKLKTIDPTIVFVLIGLGAEKEMLIDKAEEYGILNKNVFIFGPVPKEQLPQYYYESDMGSSFVIAIKELWANSANKFFDSLAAGRPVLINHEGWQMDVLEHTNSGFVLPFDLSKLDDQVLNNFIDYTLNASLLNNQKNNCLNLAERYSLDAATKKYLELFNSMGLP
ncbi:Glycosyltransferase involved in cell wall bisynthesis [Maribacter sedimenticola]|uniref:Glycosyltransferase involved in cell wall bisynthesis n=1 Tax=Maribacter sedimenticola TaxID=228956 RepID=A0ABY1SKB5_9FLAO|nr:glycosyltransferase family 4 protein [Maribacter sedimenticola]SNR66847.1 Glycosyltransferase involved in cell wall bisynthesis [Maribacter sedimenticola]